MNGEGIFLFSYGGFAKGKFIKNKISGNAVLKFPN
jgi:hypothetical protein